MVQSSGISCLHRPMNETTTHSSGLVRALFDSPLPISGTHCLAAFVFRESLTTFRKYLKTFYFRAAFSAPAPQIQFLDFWRFIISFTYLGYYLLTRQTRLHGSKPPLWTEMCILCAWIDARKHISFSPSSKCCHSYLASIQAQRRSLLWRIIVLAGGGDWWFDCGSAKPTWFGHVLSTVSYSARSMTRTQYRPTSHRGAHAGFGVACICGNNVSVRRSLLPLYTEWRCVEKDQDAMPR